MLLRKTHKGRDWSGQTLTRFVPVGCTFRDCSFENAMLDSVCFGGGMEDSRYINCSFNRATITAIAPGHARFEGCTFIDADFTHFLSHTVEFVNCEISGIVRKAFFNGTVPPEYVASLGRKVNEFRGNDFSGATLVDVVFRTGIELSLQKLPAGWSNPVEEVIS
jgi:uncharacterized protein YjbI with pentapeptide repeats